uniref:Uncharacterized protein n=1 Tax=Anguilla anguilla TaxID=7936 RepID=A0A0E9PUT4_ANGAN
MMDDSSDHITFFHISVDLCLWFLYHTELANVHSSV